MRKIGITLICTCICTFLGAQNLPGYKYAKESAPAGNEWENPLQQALNKEQPHNWFFSFTNVESARKFLPENSSLWMSLDGTWKFNWAADPSSRPMDFYRDGYDLSGWDEIEVPSNWNVFGLGKDGSQKYGKPIYVNTTLPFWYEVKVDDWKGGVMRTPPENWTMNKTRNEVGSYSRKFTLPEEWDGKIVYIDFNGVDSFFYLWINGQYVGFSKNSRNVAQFNITEYLKKGENTVSVEVYRNSDGSFLEAQDMFRLPGIFRTVALEAKPKASFRDIKITPSLVSNTSGSLAFQFKTTGGSAVRVSVYENELYSEQNKLVSTFDGLIFDSKIGIDGIKPWSAENPQMYTIVAELLDGKNNVLDIASVQTGFRSVEVRYTPASEDEFGLAGNYFYVNGKTVKLKGVNRHESEPSVGHAVTREMMKEDLFLMKKANINHVRNCHYPDDPYWYYLCDKYGIYLMDEANNESHQYRYDEASISHSPSWEAAHLNRMMSMVMQNYNHPSVIIWSMGNEAGPGMNFQSCYNAAKAYDSMRPVQYERNNNISDFGCNQYPSIKWVRKTATGTAVEKYPYHVNEYAHSMGNALGDFEEYWEAFESSNFIMGGAIWDWVDQSLWNYTSDGTKYLAYGGDFGDYPNDGQFDMNGLIFGDREPKPAYYEVKKVHQYVSAKFSDNGELDVFNKNYFEPADYDVLYTVIADGDRIAQGSIALDSPIPPRSHVCVPVPAVQLPQDKECFINLDFRQKSDLPWANAGFSVAAEQLKLSDAVVADFVLPKGKLSLSEDKTTVKGKGFEVSFDFDKGTIGKLAYGKETVLAEGPQLNAYRCFVNNDNYAYQSWAHNGLNNLENEIVNHEVVENQDGTVSYSFMICSKAPSVYEISGGTSSGRNEYKVLNEKQEFSITSYVKWTVYADGSIRMDSTILPIKDDQILPRIGYMMKLDSRFSALEYYGRGPVENYPDRCSSAFIGKYSSTVADQFVNYTKPQDMANHEDTRWLRLSSGKSGIRVSVNENSLKNAPVMSFSALPYCADDFFNAAHIFELPQPEYTYVTLDAAVNGLGGNSCGPIPMEEDILKSGTLNFSFTISR